MNQQFRKYFLHILLFILTFISTTLAGVAWLNRDLLDLSNFTAGLPYSLTLLAMLTAHEFGHYVTARMYGVDVTLPFYIPAPPVILNPFGTMGAVIRIRSPLTERRTLFDIGIAGPVAGLVVTLAVLAYGMYNLPPKEFLYSVHPEYRHLAALPKGGLTLGNSILFAGLHFLAPANAFFPPMNELYHYPYLCVGWFGLFITAMNLLPIGQLDGGHILYALAGSRIQGMVARALFVLLILIGLASLVPIPGITFHYGTTGWLLWAVILYFLIKLDHPEVPDLMPLSPGRRVLGWAMMIFFLFSFPPAPFLD